MSKYTTEVRFICENYSGLSESVGLSSVTDVVTRSLPKIFDFDFPIYDESYRATLESKILMHYYTREIGFESVGLWKLWLNKRLNEIMPYYNQLYKSTLLEFNPFYDVDITTDSRRNVDHDETTSDSGVTKTTRTDDLSEETSGTSKRTDNLNTQTDASNTTTGNTTRTDDLKHSDTTHSSTESMTAYSDTPQGTLTNVQGLTYLTNATDVTTSSTEQNNGTNTGTVKTNTTENGSGTQTTKNTGTQSTDSDITVKNGGTQTLDGSSQDNGTKVYKNIDDYLEHVRGKRGGQSYASLLAEYRKTFLNIDMMIIDDLGDLFMNLW